MSKDEFLQKMIGKPWGMRAIGWDAVDCWGLVVMYYRHVLGLEFPPNNNYSSGLEFSASYQFGIQFWEQSERFNDCMFVAYNGRTPVHVGLIINGQCLHAREDGSHVRMDRIRTLERVFSKLEYYKYADH